MTPQQQSTSWQIVRESRKYYTLQSNTGEQYEELKTRCLSQLIDVWAVQKKAAAKEKRAAAKQQKAIDFQAGPHPLVRESFMHQRYGLVHDADRRPLQLLTKPVTIPPFTNLPAVKVGLSTVASVEAAASDAHNAPQPSVKDIWNQKGAAWLAR